MTAPGRHHVESPAVPPDLERILRGLESRSPSQLSFHPGCCCLVAREWFLAMVRSAALLLGPEPSWIGRRWTWGPTTWPLAWCEAVERPELDCGALAELATLAWGCAGGSVWRVQLLEESTPERVEQWRARWKSVPGTAEWIWGERFYHEVVGIIEADATLRLWDPTAGSWREMREEGTSRRILAFRTVPPLGARAGTAATPLLQGYEVPLGRWVSAVLGGQSG